MGEAKCLFRLDLTLPTACGLLLGCFSSHRHCQAANACGGCPAAPRVWQPARCPLVATPKSGSVALPLLSTTAGSLPSPRKGLSMVRPPACFPSRYSARLCSNTVRDGSLYGLYRL
ncbi:hypothetical protein GQ53DRAFT_754372 [Thozetella sp. PMI_491]|nr:hypothetical protein GQ53DRAFT_754372 [Thozetella sp. PMI_491]